MEIKYNPEISTWPYFIYFFDKAQAIVSTLTLHHGILFWLFLFCFLQLPIFLFVIGKSYYITCITGISRFL